MGIVRDLADEYKDWLNRPQYYVDRQTGRVVQWDPMDSRRDKGYWCGTSIANKLMIINAFGLIGFLAWVIFFA